MNFLPKKGSRYDLVVDGQNYGDSQLVDFGKTENGTDFVTFTAGTLPDDPEMLHTFFNVGWGGIQPSS